MPKMVNWQVWRWHNVRVILAPSPTLLALASDDNLIDMGDDVGLSRGWDREGDFWQAGHGPAVRADKVRMFASSMAGCPGQLKAPHMVASIGAAGQSSGHQIHQVAVDRGPVETQRRQNIRQLGMRNRTRTQMEALEHRDTGLCTTQSGLLEGFA